MIRYLQKRRAQKQFLMVGSSELLKRFGLKKWYSIEEVSRVVDTAKLSAAYIAYAHAIFSQRSEFDDYYGSMKLRCTYDGLRTEVSRRFLGGAYEFTAQGVVEAYKPKMFADHFQENGEGIRSGDNGLP